MTSLKVGDLIELRAGPGRVGTVLDVVESRPRWLLVDWHTPPNTCINPLLENEGSSRSQEVTAGTAKDVHEPPVTASNDE